MGKETSFPPRLMDEIAKQPHPCADRKQLFSSRLMDEIAKQPHPCADTVVKLCQ